MWLIKPIPKKTTGIISDLKNLRPIRLLPVALKIAESVLRGQLSLFFDVDNILPNIQSGFRMGFSTATCLWNVVDSCLGSIDKRQLTSITLLDMSSAFDTIDFNLLIAKLYYYGIHGSVFDWLISYLRNRFQSTVLKLSDGSLSFSQFRELGLECHRGLF